MSNRVFCRFLAWASTLGPNGGRVVSVGLCEALKNVLPADYYKEFLRAPYFAWTWCCARAPQTSVCVQCKLQASYFWTANCCDVCNPGVKLPCSLHIAAQSAVQASNLAYLAAADMNFNLFLSRRVHPMQVASILFWDFNLGAKPGCSRHVSSQSIVKKG
eukprot:1161577-Pelagomonas_calceolata.AAC.2